MDIGFVASQPGEESTYNWSHILIPGELKSNTAADKASMSWIDLATYAREVLAAQDTRRFVLGFTLCGSFMRVWLFDRLGGIASERFDINKAGSLQFLMSILGFLCMDREELGFDPTIIAIDDERYIEIVRDGQTEQLILDEMMKRTRCIAGRATTCWKAHCRSDPHTRLVIKDSWQYTDRDEEGEILQEVTDKAVVNTARYYYHETVQVGGADDDIRTNIRKGLEVVHATNHRQPRSLFLSSTNAAKIQQKGRSSGTGMKRPSSETEAVFPPSKRSCSSPSAKLSIDTLSNRVHRRVILRDYGKPIYKAKSRAALLAGLEGCIEGHQSLLECGFLHRDISINNLMVNDDIGNPSWPAFLIGLDLAIRQERNGVSGAQGKTGTRAFMAIGALQGDQHSFMHDLESFFWVFFWICIHYKGPGESRIVERFEKWNYVDTEELAELKKGQVSHEGDFMKTTSQYFTAYYQPLIPWIKRLRNVVFPNGKRRESEDKRLYGEMREIFHSALNDPQVLRSDNPPQ
ncbi:protein kinase family protein [Aspergillus melleus]|uniref:protein kinase family protein n=1 Tax=Aspergillus melleus TaxID=138277 RepID=UPI001E8CEE5C|nr:uncharacterized protein LDX57_012818 [Aspergillus melleus]KAH8435190.1 hypothetical protein LDX57_012818 [Aspergillus melleus]